MTTAPVAHKPSFCVYNFSLKKYLAFALTGFLFILSGQTMAQSDVVVNEVDADQSGTDVAEFIELFDGGNGNFPLDGYSLVLYNGSDDASYRAFDLDTYSTDANGYFVLCGNVANVTNCDLDVSPDSNLIQNGADAVALVLGDAVDYPNDTPVSVAGLVDALVYDTNDSDDPGLLVLLNPGQPQINEDDGTDSTVDSNQRCPNGLGGNRNTDTYIQAGPTPGAVNNCPFLDEAPYVTGTTPLNNDIDVPLGSDIVINFSEAVTAAGSWFSISCVNSGVHTAVETGGPQDYTLNPHADFIEGERCTVVISAAQITDTDLDDPPDTMTEDYQFSFSMAGPPVESDLRVNEVDADQSGTDAAEFIELFDGGNGNFPLDGYSLVFYNGSDDATYRAFDLDTYSTSANGYFVLCGNAANIINCDLDVSPDSNLIQNGADAVALVFGDAINYPNGTPVSVTGLVDALVYDTNDSDDPGLLALLNPGQPQINEDGGTDSTIDSNQRCPNGLGGNRNTDSYIQAEPTPGVENNCTALEIYTIQGSGTASDYDGLDVLTIDNVVSAVGLEGFFIQTPDARDDGLVDTSNGIYVFTGVVPVVAVGDSVNVLGRVDEFYGFTEFTNTPTVTINSSGNALPTPVTLGASVPSGDPAAPSCSIEYECYEGMLVEISTGTVTGGNQDFSSDLIAEVHITAASSRTYREPGLIYPGLGGPIPTWDGNPEVFELDPDRLGLANLMIPGGSSFAASGVIGFDFGDYELWPTSLTASAAVLPRAVRGKQSGETTIGSLNLFRFATDGDYNTRLTKLSQYIRNVLGSPDILAVQEADSLGALQDLADEIAADDSSVNYTSYLVEGNDIGGIDVGFLVRSDISVDSVSQLGADEIFSYDDSLLHDRPPLLLEGRYTGNGKDFPLAVLVVHNRSLIGIETERVQLKRLAQAESTADKVQAFQVANPDAPLVVLGDFNGFEFTDGYVDVVGHIKGDFNPAESLHSGLDRVSPNLTNQTDSLPVTERYSTIYEGNAEVLDHALTSASADSWVRGLQFGRGNADAAHNQINDPLTALRSSNHDGLVLFLMTDWDGDGVADDADACPFNSGLSQLDPEHGCSIPIPTLNPVALLLMIIMLGGLGVLTLRYPQGLKR